MYTFAPALAVTAALLWPAAASAQSLAEIAQREAARRKAEAAAPKTAAPAPASAASNAAATTAQDAPTVDQASMPSGGISLAEVARREAARRKRLAASGQRGRALTSSDVKKWEPPPAADAANADADADTQKADGTKATEAGRATDAQKAPGDDAKGEDYWHGRMSAAREELRRNQSFAEALQSRINALSAEFSAKDDPYQRAQIADDRQKALAELDRLTADIDKNKKSIAEIEDDARRAGVPAGWIR
jgi:hypothetical protein